MTPQVPIPNPTNFSATAEVSVAAEQQGYHDDINQAVKAIFLRRLVDGSIKDNEARSILTSVTIEDLSADRTIVNHNEETEHFAASVNKLPVALLILEDLRDGKLNMNQMMSWAESDRRAGSGVFDQPGSDLQAPLKDVIYDLLNRSGNTAVRILVNGGLGGAAAVNGRWAEEPNLSHTRLQPVDANRFFLGNSTTHDSLWTMEELMSDHDQYSKFMKQALATNIFTDYGVRSQLADSDYVVLVNKVGILDDVDGNNRHDVGIIYNKRTHERVGYSFFTTTPYNETDPSDTQQAEQSLKDMGRYTLRYAGARTTTASGSAGQQALQQELHSEVRMRY
jgi:beta-lactamase class A